MTDKQFSYLKSLLVARGHAHPVHGLRASGKKLCGVPNSAVAWDAFRKRLDTAEASRIIDQLK